MATLDSSVGRATLHRLGGADGLPDLLLIHGFGSDRYSWSATAPSFFATHAVWAVELPGHTNAPIDAGSGTPKSMSEAVKNAVTGKLSAPFPVVGHSLGGAVAIELANIYPELVSGMVAIAPAGFGSRTNDKFLEEFPALEHTHDAQGLLELLVSRPKLISPQMVQHVLGFLNVAGRREALANIARQLGSMQPVSMPAGIPIFAVWGDGDVINPYNSASTDSLVSQMNILEGVGHLPHVEQARKTNSVIAELISTASVIRTP